MRSECNRADVARRPLRVWRRAWDRRDSQRGQAVLITLLVVLGVGLSLLTASATRSVSVQVRAETNTRAALADAKQALVGRAIADNDRPGSLPCPDAVTNVAGNVPDDGIADAFVGNDCPSYIGRLPWRTLGLPDLRDETGERLWYALSSRFRDHVSAQPINSDTKGNRLVYAKDNAVVLAPEAVAVIFAPGTPLGNQVRDTVAALCAVTGTVIQNRLCATNYLDTASGVSNASGTGPYIAAPRSTSFNDRVAVLTTAELIPPVETRVAKELFNALIGYRIESTCQCYPWAATALGVSVVGTNRGRIPSATALPEAWGSGFIPTLPAWFDANKWGDIIHYAVGKTSLTGAGAACLTCVDPTLTVDGLSGYSALFFTPGPAGASRPSLLWTDYLEDAQNSDNINDLFVTPTSTAVTRDRLNVMPGGSLAQCGANAQMLIKAAPCDLRTTKGGGPKKSSIKAVCRFANQNIQSAGCTCAPQAAAMLKNPCSRRLKPGGCQTNIATLRTC